MRLLLRMGLVALGSALGALARWGVAEGVSAVLDSTFPWATLLINVSGSLFLGWFAEVLAERVVARRIGWLDADDLRLLVAVGFTGGYTTFSTFEYDTLSLLDGGDGLGAVAYVVGSVFLGLAAVRGGIWLARR